MEYVGQKMSDRKELPKKILDMYVSCLEWIVFDDCITKN